ncbi:MAG: RimK family protein [Candidatus Marinimicrobia bacterium]|nr:RimK family protein [Candidatus Neomarinimicrobiota bacterium]
MPTLIVVEQPEKWGLEIPDVPVVAAKTYLTSIEYVDQPKLKVFNLCKSYRYQSMGYYVSLLAEARGHKPVPNISTIQDTKMMSLIRLVSEDLDDLIQKSLEPLKSREFGLTIYFGKNFAKRYDRLCNELFRSFQVPFLKADFIKNAQGRWLLQNVSSIASQDIPNDHKADVVEFTRAYFSGKRFHTRKKQTTRYHFAILHDPLEAHPPSNARAIKRFVKAAESLRVECDFITKDDYGRIAEFDALFIRETTNVNHHTFRFARKAVAEGLVVVDDPDSILKCTNKVYLAELLQRHKVKTPKTMVVHKQNLHDIIPQLQLPCILKQPDSAFSQGVSKADTEETFLSTAKALLEKSELVIAQEFMPTDFDWRIGVFNQKPLFACKYFMAKKHWQILKTDSAGKLQEGNFETVSVEVAPPKVIKTALKAANLIGDGLYGVDLKQVGNEVYVIEVNDNPNIDAGVEDQLLNDHLYLQIMEGLIQRVEQNKSRWS